MPRDHKDDGHIVVRFAPSEMGDTETTEIRATTYLSEAKYDFYEDNQRITLALHPTREDGDYQGISLEIAGSQVELTSLFTRCLEAVDAVIQKLHALPDGKTHTDVTLWAPKPPKPAPVDEGQEAEAVNA